MRLATFAQDGDRRVGVLDDEAVVDVAAVLPEMPDDMVDVIAWGPTGLERIAAAAADAPRLPLDSVRLLAPIPRPSKNIMAVGRNYRDHAAEFSRSGFDASERQEVPDDPIFFTKAPTTVVGPGEAIDTANDPTGTTDYEGEVAVVIGRPGRRIAPEQALEHVYGYTIANDVTARALQRRHVQWFLGKSPDTFCPMGPAITTADELGDLSRCWLRTWVNGELRQESPITLIFDVPTLVAQLSAALTLEPGDIIATGTPLGTGMGLDPPVYLREGDVVRVAVDGIGTLENPVR